MEEETESPHFAVKYWKYSLLQVLMLTFVVACTATPTGVQVPAPLPVISADAEGKENTLAPVSVGNQSLSQTSFMGVEFEYDERILGTLNYGKVAPIQAAVQDDALPERIVFGFSGLKGEEAAKLTVFPIEQYAAISSRADSQISLLRSLLSDTPLQLNRPLPLLPHREEDITFRSDPISVDFQNGSGIGFFIQVDRDHITNTDEVLFYTFQGLTDDDLFYVSLLVPVTVDVSHGADSSDNSSASSYKVNSFDLKNLETQGQIPSLLRSIHSLRVTPSNGFPSAKLPAFASFPGVLITYDPDVIKSVTYTHEPVIVFAPDGKSVFLADLPDMIRLVFEQTSTISDPSVLTVQPIRDERGDFHPSIPQWQREEVVSLEQLKNENNVSQYTRHDENFIRVIKFQNGIGRRSLNGLATEVAESGQTNLVNYLFEGITEDGLYKVQFIKPLVDSSLLHEVHSIPGAELSADLLSSLALLDQMIQSLAISSNASEDSSIPNNPLDCINDAEFIGDLSVPDYSIVERGQVFEKSWEVRNIGSCTWMPDYQLIQAGGNPLSWQTISIPGIVAPGETATISVNLRSPQTSGKYHAWWQLADETSTPFGPFYSVLFEAPKPATDIPGHGTIEGHISYPAGATPALVIYFLRTDESERYALSTEAGWTRFVNQLPIGEYYVFARVLGDESDSGGGFTMAVTCGLKCEDHTLQKVVVEEGKATIGIDILDWYAPAGSFPLP